MAMGKYKEERKGKGSQIIFLIILRLLGKISSGEKGDGDN